MSSDDSRISGSAHPPVPREDRNTLEVDSTESDGWLSRRERSKLWLGHFQQLTTLTVTGAAGLLLLLQLGVMERSSPPFFAALVACGIALILSLGGQAKVLDGDEHGADLWRDLREIRRAAFLALGVAAAAFVVLILS